MNRLRSYVGTGLIFIGLFVVLVGGLIVKFGAWVGDKEVIDSTDLSDDELRQIYKEATEARSKEEEK
tara:strand:+ start:231 stop:431 length:201 start_codon:yes stop_codon:yes gene_type:complete